MFLQVCVYSGRGGTPASGSRSLSNLWSQVLSGGGGGTPSAVTGPVQSPVPGPARGVPSSSVTGSVQSPVSGHAGGGGTPARTGHPQGQDRGYSSPLDRTRVPPPPPTREQVMLRRCHAGGLSCSF